MFSSIKLALTCCIGVIGLWTSAAIGQGIERKPGAYWGPDLPLAAPPVATTPAGKSLGTPETAPVRVDVLNNAPVAATYDVTAADQNLRRVLARWAKASGWTFEPAHWALARDIPVGGAAQFDADFKGSVRLLLKSTLLVDLPAQPCFYSNKVLRVIPASELCARSTAPAN